MPALALAWLLAAAPPQAGFVVYAAGDIAYCRWASASGNGAARTAAAIAADMAAEARAAVITMGDHTYPVGRIEEFHDCYDASWGRFKSITYPSPGDHEYAGGRADGYFSYFGKPSYYSFALDDWHLISLNSKLSGAAMQAQLAWLKQDLADHPARCTLAYWHHPLYSSGLHGNVAHMHDAWQILHAAGAELVLSGHDHDYERFLPQDADGQLDMARGIVQIVAGTGGAFPTPVLWGGPHSAARENSRSGVLKLRLLPGRYAWEFLEARFEGFPNAPPPDRGQAQCHD